VLLPAVGVRTGLRPVRHPDKPYLAPDHRPRLSVFVDPGAQQFEQLLDPTKPVRDPRHQIIQIGGPAGGLIHRHER